MAETSAIVHDDSQGNGFLSAVVCFLIGLSLDISTMVCSWVANVTLEGSPEYTQDGP